MHVIFGTKVKGPSDVNVDLCNFQPLSPIMITDYINALISCNASTLNSMHS